MHIVDNTPYNNISRENIENLLLGFHRCIEDKFGFKRYFDFSYDMKNYNSNSINVVIL